MRPAPGLDRPLALAGLLANAAGLPLLLIWILAGGPLATATLVVGLAAILPALVVGLVGAAGLLARRRWGRIVAIVALGLSLAVSLGYGIVWLVLVPEGRAISAELLAPLWLAQLLALLHWCLPRPG
jgi:hypothetical protein